MIIKKKNGKDIDVKQDQADRINNKSMFLAQPDS
jgi:hypothetical protein